jgi:maltose alpha-D-glucosyltransferase/alpha-amylase
MALSAGLGEAQNPEFVLARLRGPNGEAGQLYGALRSREFSDELLAAILRRRRFAGEEGELVASHTRVFRGIWSAEGPPPEPSVSRADQDNSTVFYGDRFALKLLRKVEEGPHPEVEIGALLTKKGFASAARLAGAIEYRGTVGEPMTIALLHGFAKGSVDSWDYTLDHLGIFFVGALARSPGGPGEEVGAELLASYVEFVRLLGQRTGEMHVALASEKDDPVFAPEPFTDFYRHGLYHGMLGRLGRTMDQLGARVTRLPEAVQADARSVMERRNALRERFRFFRDQRLNAMRIRIHGDYHLGQVLFTGRDFVIIDFEGDPGRPLSERRIKRSPLNDVAEMIDSFYHASHGVLFGETPGVIPRPEAMDAMEKWAHFWARTVSIAFLDSYLATPGVADLLPRNPEHVQTMIRLYLADIALRKLMFELAHAPERLRVPAHLILDLLEAS